MPTFGKSQRQPVDFSTVICHAKGDMRMPQIDDSIEAIMVKMKLMACQVAAHRSVAVAVGRIQGVEEGEPYDRARLERIEYDTLNEAMLIANRAYENHHERTSVITNSLNNAAKIIRERTDDIKRKARGNRR